MPLEQDDSRATGMPTKDIHDFVCLFRHFFPPKEKTSFHQILKSPRGSGHAGQTQHSKVIGLDHTEFGGGRVAIFKGQSILYKNKDF